MRDCVISVDNSGAGSGNSDVIGCHIRSSGSPGSEDDAMRAAAVRVRSSGGGMKRSLLMDVAGTFRARDVNFRCQRVGGSGGTYYAVEVNHASAILSLNLGNANGDDADVSRTLGVLRLSGVDLENAKSNGRSFDARRTGYQITCSEEGPLVGGVTRFVRFGSGDSAVTEIKLRMHKSVVVQKLIVRSATPPGAGRTDTWVVRKNGVDTSLTTSLVNTATFSQDLDNAVTFASGDDLSVKQVGASGTGTTEVVITMEVY